MIIPEGHYTLIALIAVVYVATIWTRFSRSRSVGVPPGPPMASWISGHAAILPLKKSWEVYTEWAHKYGMFDSSQFCGEDLIMKWP